MASSDWYAPDHRAAPRPPERYPETVLWTLTKDARTAQAVARRLPHGRELRISMNSALLWSELFAPARDGDLEPLAEDKRSDFRARGWTDA